ncbi:hypothetical protein ABVK25_005772 [Lepraria finkii]|uniref:Uncharacterized protein n=1 Tax=Lepraria finkii TaxID=1340010 RepID=A0ABR4BD55_9LECA
MPADIDTDLAMELDQLTDDKFTSHATEDARERCLRTSDMERAVYLSGRPDPHVMDGSIDRIPGTLQHVDLEHPTISQGNTVSPLQLTWSSDISTVEVSRPQDDVVDGPSIRPLVPQGMDYETLIVTLQLLRLYVLKLSRQETPDSVAKRSFQGSNQAALLAILSSDWPRMEVEDLLNWAYKDLARAIGRG